MKLFTKYNRINLLTVVIIFLLSGISFYFLLRYVLISQVDEDLTIEKNEIENYISKYNRIPEVIPVKGQHISYTLIDHSTGEKKFETGTLEKDAEKEIFRSILFEVNAGGKWYKVIVRKSLEGTDNLIQSISIITLSTILLILIVSVIINRVILRRLWKPFYNTLQVMRGFELGKKQVPVFQVTGIDEFAFMNATLQEVAAKADHDYRLLKEFTENASHELQTPLAIIQSKLDLLIQDEHLSESQSRTVQGAYEAIQKLSRLNQSLLLLAKIENGQYAELSDINFSQKITSKLEQFGEMIQAKGIAIETVLDESVSYSMNPVLADILLNNLLSNAIKYNITGGSIRLNVQNGLLMISNPAKNGALLQERMFSRFGKTGQVKDGVGLGLAIVKQVAVISGLSTTYTYQDGQHHFLFKWG